MEIYENLSLVDLQDEEWIDCVGYDGIYQISNLGRVKSVERWLERSNGRGFLLKERIRKQRLNSKFSTVRVGLCENNFIKNFVVSRLVYFSFNYNVKNLPEYYVMHKDGNWGNNNLNNLKIASQNEISKLTFDMGKVEHLKLGNPILSKHKRKFLIIENGEEKLNCKTCSEIKPIIEFETQLNECKECRYEKESKRTIEIRFKKELKINKIPKNIIDEKFLQLKLKKELRRCKN